MICIERDGSVTFRVYLLHAQCVEVVGSFSDREHGHAWLNNVGDGWWSIHLHLPIGEHEFAYLVDDRFWVPDYAAAGLKRTPDGQMVSVLSVEKPAVGGRMAGRTAALAERPKVEVRSNAQMAGAAH